MSNLLAQGKEIKRLKKEDERRQKESEEADLERGVEERERAVEQFENTMMGLEGGEKKMGKANGLGRSNDEDPGRTEGRGVKRKFELDEEEMLRNAKEERAKARKALDEEKVDNQRMTCGQASLIPCSLLSQPSHHSGFLPSLHLRTNHEMRSL